MTWGGKTAVKSPPAASGRGYIHTYTLTYLDLIHQEGIIRKPGKSMMSGRPALAPSPAPSPAPPHTTTATATPQQDLPPPPPPPFPPKSQVIPIVPTEFARIYNVTHPFVVLSLYYFSFPSIVANPVLALQYLLVPLSVLQLAYVVTCLPATTTTSSGGGGGESGSGSSSSFSPFSTNLPPTTSKKLSSSPSSSSSLSLSKLKGKGKGKGKAKKAQGNGLDLSGKVVVSKYIYISPNFSPNLVCQKNKKKQRRERES